MNTLSPMQFAGVMLLLQGRVDHAVKEGLEAGAQILEDEMKRVLGTYDYGWPPLSPVTIANKGGRDEPGIDTGEMKASISHVLDTSHSACIGTDVPQAEYFELGTSRQPPRSFAAGAAIHKGREAVDAVQREFVAALLKP